MTNKKLADGKKYQVLETVSISALHTRDYNFAFLFLLMFDGRNLS